MDNQGNKHDVCCFACLALGCACACVVEHANVVLLMQQSSCCICSKKANAIPNVAMHAYMLHAYVWYEHNGVDPPLMPNASA